MSETIILRIAGPSDQDLLTALIAASYATLEDGAYDRERLSAALPLMSSANPKLLVSGTYHVAEVNGEPAGCGGWTFEKPGTGEIVDGVAHVRHFATHPRHLRKGVARLLIERCIADAAAAGARVLKTQSTLPAERFYASAGFRRVALVDVAMGPGVTLPAIEMQRELP